MKAQFSLFILALFSSLTLSARPAAVEPDSLTFSLQELVVTARQPAVKLVGSTIVSTIPGSNLADLGTALDVLAQLPLIKVNDDEVSVTGRTNLEIYIDGRPMRDSRELQHLLSGSLAKVELLMAPGAAYSSTTDAVLRITTRRSFMQGLSVTDRATLQRRRRWSAADYLDLAYRSAGWEFFIDASISRDNSLAKGLTTNTLLYHGDPTVVGSTQLNSSPSTSAQVKGGFSYSSGAQSAGAYYSFTPDHGFFTNTGTEWLDAEPPLQRVIDKNNHSRSQLVSGYYDNTFAGSRHLHFDGDLRLSSARSSVATTYPGAPFEAVNSADNTRSRLLAGKLYLDLPLWAGLFTLGTQDSYTRTALDYRMLNPLISQYIPSSSTVARQTSAALFASWTRMFGPLSLTAGARYEYVDYSFTVNGCRDEDVSRRSHLVTPDVSVGYTFADDTQLTLSYRPSTVRPPYSRLTGSLSYVGQHEIEGGNPALRDERMHDVRLLGFWRGFMLSTDFVRSFDTYAYVKQLYAAPSLQLLMHPINIDISALSLCLAWSRSVGRWTPDIYVEMYRQWLAIGPQRYDKPLFSYSFDNTFALPGSWMLTLNLSGRTHGDMHTNRFGATLLTADASVGRTFLNKSITVKLSATDIFNTANYDWTMSTYGVYVNKRQSYDKRGLSLSLIYNFQPRKSSYKGRPASETEMKRL